MNNPKRTTEENRVDDDDGRPKTSTHPDALNIASEHFDPMLALYTPGFMLTDKKPKVTYQNLAALESALNRYGIWNLTNLKKQKAIRDAEQPKSAKPSGSGVLATSSTITTTADVNARRFQPHQMPIRGTKKTKVRHQRNLLAQMSTMSGPMSLLEKFRCAGQRVRVVVRNEKGVHGHSDGYLRCYDKYWNLVLSDVTEVVRQRKRQFTANKIIGTAKDCTKHLEYLGIELPATQTKSINRKIVEVRRQLASVMIRGEQIVLVSGINDE